MNKNTLITIFFVGLIVSNLFASNDAGWTDYFSNERISIQVKKVECHEPNKGLHREFLLFRFENKTTQNLDVKFNQELWYNNKLLKTDKNGAMSIHLNPQQVLEGQCGTIDKALAVFCKNLDLKPTSILSNYSLTSIAIKEN